MKRILLLATAFSFLTIQFTAIKAQDSVFSYTHQGTTLYYIVDSVGNAVVVPPLYPYLFFSYDTVTIEPWDGHTKPQGSVVIPDSVPYDGSNHAVTTIDFCAFYLCDSITSVTLPTTLQYIDSSAFERCIRMESVVIPSVKTIDYSAFYNCTALQSMNLPEGLTTLGSEAISECISLVSINLPSTLTSIGRNCFWGDISLSAVTIPASVDTIKANVFRNCQQLQSVTFDGGLKHIGYNAFYNCLNLQSISLPSTLTSIESHAFSHCSSLQSISLPEGLTSIGAVAFNNSGLTNLVLPEGLTSLGEYAFSDCVALQSVRLPSTLDVISSTCFGGDSSLTSVIIPEGVDSINDYAFHNCPLLPTVTLPQSLRSIGYAAFSYCTSIDSILCPDGIHNIGDGAFAFCPNLGTFRLPEQLEAINPAILWESRITTLVVPPHVTRIEKWGLSGCSSLHTLTLPAALTFIGDSAFYSTTHLDTLVMGCSEPPSVGPNVFFSHGATLVVPCGASEAYRQHNVWGNFSNIVEDCTGIENSEFGVRNYKVYVRDGRIVVEGTDGEPVTIYDIMGRPMVNHALPAGVYFVKVGQHPEQKIVVTINIQ